MKQTQIDYETVEVERIVTDYETVEIEREITICDLCGATTDDANILAHNPSLGVTGNRIVRDNTFHGCDGCIDRMKRGLPTYEPLSRSTNTIERLFNGLAELITDILDGFVDSVNDDIDARFSAITLVVVAMVWIVVGHGELLGVVGIVLLSVGVWMCWMTR